jgi:hypothetical protein
MRNPKKDMIPGMAGSRIELFTGLYKTIKKLM